MSVTSGFFNSVNRDRLYNAEQMSDIFSGVINDGIFSNVGTALFVKADTGFNITVGIGKAWFNGKWVLNDAILPLTLDDPEVLLDRIDAVVVEVNKSEDVRAGNIKIVKGQPASTPKEPELTKSTLINQYPLAYILVKAGSTAVTQANITNKVGTGDCPYITGILQVQNIDNIVAQWGQQWIEWFANEQQMSEEAREAIQRQWDTWFSETSTAWDTWFSTTTTENEEEYNTWITAMKEDFMAWFNELQAILEPDVAANLANKILLIEQHLENFTAAESSYDNSKTELKAKNVQDALDEIPVTVFEVTLEASKWNEKNENTITVSGLSLSLATMIGVSDTATEEQWKAATNALLKPSVANDNSVLFTSYGAIPTTDIPILIYAWPKRRNV